MQSARRARTVTTPPFWKRCLCSCWPRRHPESAYSPRIIHVQPSSSLTVIGKSPASRSRSSLELSTPDSYPDRVVTLPSTAIRRSPSPTPPPAFTDIEQAKTTLRKQGISLGTQTMALTYIWRNSENPTRDLLKLWKDAGTYFFNKGKIAEFIVWNISNDETLLFQPTTKSLILLYLSAIGDIQEPAGIVSSETSLKALEEYRSIPGNPAFKFSKKIEEVRALRTRLKASIDRFCDSPFS